MNQTKIGKFISQCRKERGFLQKDIAARLGVSEKTVSKWECGNGLPEVVFMEPLCRILGITVNELLAGESIPILEMMRSIDRSRLELVKQLVGTHKKLIAVLVNCKPLCISYLKENCAAVIEAFNGGDFGGLAVAELIAGKFNPSGKLSISFPQHSAQTPCYYNQYTGWHGGQYVDLKKGNVYDFGDGLSYSEFEYSNMRLSKNRAGKSGYIDVSVDVTNKGSMDGKETVMLFVNDVISSILTPTKQLKGFEKVFIKSGETKTVTIRLDIKELALVTPDLKYEVENGEFEIMIGKNTKEYLTETLTIR